MLLNKSNFYHNKRIVNFNNTKKQYVVDVRFTHYSYLLLQCYNNKVFVCYLCKNASACCGGCWVCVRWAGAGAVAVAGARWSVWVPSSGPCSGDTGRGAVVPGAVTGMLTVTSILCRRRRRRSQTSYQSHQSHYHPIIITTLISRKEK